MDSHQPESEAAHYDELKVANEQAHDKPVHSTCTAHHKEGQKGAAQEPRARAKEPPLL
jgi:hypothetical protein